MSRILIAPNAFGPFYRTAFSVLIEAEQYASLKTVVPASVDVFLLTAEGIITCPQLEPDPELNPELNLGPPEQRPPLELIGMAIGLKAILVSKTRLDCANTLIKYCETQGMFHVPRVHILSKFAYGRHSKAAAFIADVLSQQLKQSEHDVATTQRQIATLRGQHERLWLNQEKAQRMIRGAGYKTNSVCFSLTPGPDTVNQSAGGFKQYLPSDLMGLVGLKLFIAKAADEGALGHLHVRISRCADDVLFCEKKLDYANISDGWLALDFLSTHSNIFGDGFLEVLWHGAGGPELALADVAADRYGDASGRTLALEIEKGLVQPAVTLERLDEAGPVVPVRIIPGNALLDLGQYYAGKKAEHAANEALGGQVLSVSQSGWLQTHILTDGPSGIRLPGLVSETISKVRTRCFVPQQCVFNALGILMVAPQKTPLKTIEALLPQIGAPEGLPLSGSDLESGCHWNAVILSSVQERQMVLSVQKLDQPRGDIILASRSLDGQNSYGQARWQSLELFLASPGSSTDKEGVLMASASCEVEGEIRSQRMTEMYNDISFYRGGAYLDEVSETLGFSPMVVSEETGSLQTHPFQGGASAAILKNGIPSGTVRIACEVGTAHAGADDCIYILAALPSGTADQVDAIDQLVLKVREGAFGGYDDGSAIQWTARRLKAGSVEMITMEMVAAVKQPMDAVFAAVSVSGNDSFAWCRWYSYAAIVADDQQCATPATAE